MHKTWRRRRWKLGSRTAEPGNRDRPFLLAVAPGAVGGGPCAPPSEGKLGAKASRWAPASSSSTPRASSPRLPRDFWRRCRRFRASALFSMELRPGPRCRCPVRNRLWRRRTERRRFCSKWPRSGHFAAPQRRREMAFPRAPPSLIGPVASFWGSSFPLLSPDCEEKSRPRCPPKI